MEMIFKFQVKVKKKGKFYISTCPDLDVITQGYTEKEALRNIKEAVEGFLKTCLEMGTLWKVLDDCGIKPAKVAHRHPPEGRRISVPLPLLVSKHKERAGLCHA